MIDPNCFGTDMLDIRVWIIPSVDLRKHWHGHSPHTLSSYLYLLLDKLLRTIESSVLLRMKAVTHAKSHVSRSACTNLWWCVQNERLRQVMSRYVIRDVAQPFRSFPVCELSASFVAFKKLLNIPLFLPLRGIKLFIQQVFLSLSQRGAYSRLSAAPI